MDITKKGWKCDICGTEFYEDLCGFKNVYSIEVYSNESFVAEEDYEHVCFSYIENIIVFINSLNKGED
jgi:hypothetical protein